MNKVITNSPCSLEDSQSFHLAHKYLNRFLTIESYCKATLKFFKTYIKKADFKSQK